MAEGWRDKERERYNFVSTEQKKDKRAKKKQKKKKVKKSPSFKICTTTYLKSLSSNRSNLDSRQKTTCRRKKIRESSGVNSSHFRQFCIDSERTIM